MRDHSAHHSFRIAPWLYRWVSRPHTLKLGTYFMLAVSELKTTEMIRWGSYMPLDEPKKRSRNLKLMTSLESDMWVVGSLQLQRQQEKYCLAEQVCSDMVRSLKALRTVIALRRLLQAAATMLPISQPHSFQSSYLQKNFSRTIVGRLRRCCY